MDLQVVMHHSHPHWIISWLLASALPFALARQSSLLRDEGFHTCQLSPEPGCECGGSFVSSAFQQEEKLVDGRVKLGFREKLVVGIQSLQDFEPPTIFANLGDGEMLRGPPCFARQSLKQARPSKVLNLVFQTCDPKDDLPPEVTVTCRATIKRQVLEGIAVVHAWQTTAMPGHPHVAKMATTRGW